MTNPDVVRWLILLGTAWLVGSLWMCHRAKAATQEKWVKRCGGRP